MLSRGAGTRITIQTESTTSITTLTQTYFIFQHSKSKTPLSLTMAATQQRSPHTSTPVTTTDIKTNMHHIHTSIVSRHQATRGNNKILRTPPPHICTSEEILPRLTGRTLAQLITNKSPFLKSYLHTSSLQRTTLLPLNLWTDPAGVTVLLARWTEKLAGVTRSENIRLLPLARGHGSGYTHTQVASV